MTRTSPAPAPGEHVFELEHKTDSVRFLASCSSNSEGPYRWNRSTSRMIRVHFRQVFIIRCPDEEHADVLEPELAAETVSQHPATRCGTDASSAAAQIVATTSSGASSGCFLPACASRTV